MEELTREDLDILGEIANISLGNAATTLSMMVNHKVNITTPNIKIINRSESMDDFENTCIFVQIHYVLGLAGNNVFILKERDVLCLTNLMMGGDGTAIEGTIGEMELSAVSEAMNQMMGTSATSMATMLERNVDISTPQVNAIDVESVKVFEKMFETYCEKFVKVAFKLEIEGLIKSTMVQLYPVSFAKDMVAVFKANKK
ncbi:MAG: flagellar motor switch phosphatase FliY [Lachnospiraceae bacterium]|nr:flagellar motor switch phosphatase FliY [Lachnospiraceae bacterium]MBR4993470.1 flagellar motor switch phosphatase FliY [Lachnospiraceae bacterium]MBR5944125.1 flagellar motor switch phosphatase FliY [Lachnospiraceae bacterium]